MKYKQLFQLKHLVFGAVLLGLIFAGLNCGREKEELYNYVPEDAGLIFTMDFQAFTRLDQYKDFYSIWKESLGDDHADEKIAKFLKEADIDLERDVSKVVFALHMDAGMKVPKVAAVIKAAFKKEKLITALKNSELDIKEDTYNAVPLLKIDEYKPGKTSVLAFLKPSYLVVGMEAQVKKVLDVAKGKLKSVYANKKMETFLKIAQKGHIIAMTFLVPDELKKQKSPIQQMGVDYSRMESLIFTLDRDSVVFRALNPGYEENKKIADLLNGFKASAAAKQPGNDEEKQMLEMYKESTIKAFDDEIRFSMPTGKLLTMVSRIAAKNLTTALQKGKQKATMGDMKSIRNAIESYITDNYRAPEGSSMAEIRDKLEPFYIRELPLKDGWGNDFIYMHGTGDDMEAYSIASPGRDGVFEGWEQTGSYRVTSIEGFDNDIIFTSGALIYGPRVR